MAKVLLVESINSLPEDISIMFNAYITFNDDGGHVILHRKFDTEAEAVTHARGFKDGCNYCDEFPEIRIVSDDGNHERNL